ncbi:MAG: iron-containing alcohol dehydrogenase, partial [Spirochaetia bacterium]|nr:iron-containing alcohol dehydrogenase [Spirochaetia bacterium]
MANRITLNQTSYHGKGAIKEIVNEVKTHGWKKALVCTDPDLLKFGVTKKVTDILDGAGLAYEVYSDIKPNPPVENVKSGVEFCKKCGADYIIAIGG